MVKFYEVQTFDEDGEEEGYEAVSDPDDIQQLLDILSAFTSVRRCRSCNSFKSISYICSCGVDDTCT